MNETEAILGLLPEGMFANAAELQSAIDEGGIESIYPLLPEGMFADEQEFVSEYSVKKKDGTESVLEDGSLEPVAIEGEVVVDEQVERARNLRPTARINEDGTESTVLMASMEVDGKNVAIPTLFPKDPNNFTSDPADWMELDAMEAYDTALERGEVFEFDTQEDANAFAEGSWKEQPAVEKKPKTFDDSLGMVSPELIDRGDEGQVARELSTEFKDFGFDFETTGIGDAIKVTARNGETMDVDLDPAWYNFGVDEGEEAKSLRKFLTDNKSRSEEATARDGLDAQYELTTLAAKDYGDKEAEFLEAEIRLKDYVEKNGRELTEEQMAEYNSLFETYESVGNEMVKLYENYEAQELVLNISSDEFESEYQGEKATALEQSFGKNNITGLISDVGVRAVDKGFAQGGTIRSSNNLMTNANEVTDEDINEFLRAQKALAEQGNSDEFKAFLADVKENGGGWGALFSATKKYPGILPELFVTSAVAMANKEVAKGALGGGISFALTALAAGQLGPQLLIPEEIVTVPSAFLAGVMGGAGYSLESGLSFGEFLNEEMAEKQGVALKDIDMSVENIRDVLSDEEAMDRIRDRANGRGIAIGAMGILGGMAAAQTTRVIGRSLVRMRRPLSIIGGSAVGLVSEGAGESVGRFVAGQKQDKTEIFLESAAMGPVTTVGVGVGLAKTPTYTLNKEQVNGRTMARFIRDASDADVAGATIEIKNDKSLLSEARDKRQTASDKNIIRGQLREAGIDNEEQVERLAELELEKRKLKGQETTVAERKRKRIQNEIDAILDGDSYFFEETTDEKGNRSSKEVRVTRREAIMALLQDDIPNPTETEIENKLAELYNEALSDIGKIDAVQERETAEVDVEEQSEAGPEVDTEVRTEEEIKVDEEAEALSAQFEAEGTPDVDVVEDDVTIRSREGSPELDGRRRKIVEKAKARAKTLKNFGVKFIMHETQAQFDEATGKGNSKGYYDGKNTIHINLENANTRTVAHEAFHALFLSRVRGNDLDAQAMAIATMQTIRKSVAKDRVLSDRIDAFISSYEDNQIDEEALAEIFGYISEGYGTLTPAQKNSIKSTIVDLIYKLTGLELGERWTQDDQNVLDVFNSLSTKFEKGEEIVEEDVAGLDVTEEKKEELTKKGLLNNRVSEYQKKRRNVQTERDNLIGGLIQLANATTDIRATQYLNNLRKKIGVSRLKSLEGDMRKVISNDKLTQQEKEGRLDGLEKKYDNELERIASTREAAKARIKEETERLKPKVEQRKRKAEKTERISKISDELKEISAKLRREKAEGKRNYEGEELKEYTNLLQEQADEQRAKLKAEREELKKKDVLPVIQKEQAPVEEKVEAPVEEVVEETVESEPKTDVSTSTVRERVGKEKYSALENAVRDLLEYTDEVGDQPTRGQKNALTRRETKVNKLVAELKLSSAEQAVVQTFVQERVNNKREAEAKMREEREINKAAAERGKKEATLRTLNNQLIQATRELIKLESIGATESMKSQAKSAIDNIKSEIDSLMDEGPSKEKAPIAETVIEEVPEKKAAPKKAAPKTVDVVSKKPAPSKPTPTSKEPTPSKPAPAPKKQVVKKRTSSEVFEDMFGSPTEQQRIETDARNKQRMLEMQAEIDGITVKELQKREAAREQQRKETFSRQTAKDVKDAKAEVKKLKEELKDKKGEQKKPLRDAELRLKEAQSFIDNLRTMSVDEALRLRTPVPSGREQRVASQQVAERRFDLSALRVIGKGSSRVVYDLGDGKALKVAINPKGLEQNQTLGPWDVEDNLKGFVPEVYEEGPDYLVVENVPFDVILDDGRYGASVIDSFIYGLEEAYNRGPGRLQEYLEEYKEDMGQFVDYELLPGDFNKPDSWGIRKDGTIVLVDEGALNPRVHFGSEPEAWSVEDFAAVEKNRGYRGPRQTLNKYSGEDIEYLMSDPNTDVVAEEGNVILYSVVDPNSVVRIMQEGIPSDMNADFSRSRTELGDGGSLVAVEVPADAVSVSETGIVSVDGPVPAKSVKKAYDSIRVRKDSYPMREDVFRDELQDRETGEVGEWAEEFLEEASKEGFLYRDSDGLRTGREQRPLEVRELAMRYNMNQDGFTISTNVNQDVFRKAAERIGLGVKRAASGSLYLTRGGKKINPFKEYDAYSKRVARDRKSDIKKLQEQTRKREEERNVREEAMRLREEKLNEYRKQYPDFPDEMIPPSDLSGREQRESINDATKGFSVESVVKFAKERGYKDAVILKMRPDAKDAIKAYDARMDRVNKEIDDIIARVEKRAKTDPIIQGKPNSGLRTAAINKRKLQAVQEYLRGSKVYEDASDVGREAMDIAAMRKAGKRVKSSPKPETILGINQDGNIDKENLKQKIRDMARSSRLTAATMRALMKQLGKDVSELKRGGLLTPVQATMLLKRMGQVNPLNEVSVERYMQFAERVFLDADYAGDLKAILDNRKRAIKNLGKLGVAPELISPLNMLLRMNPSMLPDVQLDDKPLVKVVRELTDLLSKRKAVLSLPERSDLSQKVTKILSLIDEELSLKHELFEVYEGYPKVDTKGGLVSKSGLNTSVAKTVDAMVDEGIISKEDADILKKYKAELAAEPSEEETAQLEKERQEKKDELIQELKTLDPLTRRFPLKEENDLVRRFNEATKSEFLSELTNAELTNMLRVADNISNGFVPHMTQVMVEKIASHEKAATVTENIEGVLPGTMLQFYNKMLEGVGLRNLYKRARRNPTKYFDQIMGNYKSNPVYQAMFRDLGIGYSRYNSEMLNISERLRKLDNKLAKKRGLYKTPNQVARAKFQLGAYMMQLEFENNPTETTGIFSAQELLRATIDKSYQSSGVKYSERQAKMLEEILAELESLTVEEAELAKKEGREARPLSELMRDGVGEKNAMISKQQLEVAKGMREIFDELTPKAQYTAGVVRGIPFQAINNYFHRVVQAEMDPSDDKAGPEAIRMRISSNMQPSTRGKNLTERVTRSAPPVIFDPFVSVNRGARFTLLDYHLTEPVRTARRTQSLLKKGQADRTNRQRQMVNFINDAINFTNENVMGNASSFNDELSQFLEYVKKTGYRQALGSAFRALSEFNSNFVFAAVIAPTQFIKGMSYRAQMMTNGGSILRNTGSVQATRLFPESDKALKSGFVDQISDSMNPTGNRVRSVVRNVSEVILQNTLGRVQRKVNSLADKVITRPDQMVNRPLWFGFFADEFQKVSGQEVDFNAISDNNEAYMDRYREAIDAAVKKADDMSVLAGATDNPYLGVVNALPETKRSNASKVIQLIDTYMTRFLVFEYAGFRTGVQALMGNGMISKAQGGRLIMAVTMRMMIYRLSYDIIRAQISKLYRDDDDEEKDINEQVGNAIKNTALNVAMGTRGQLFRGGVSTITEGLNEYYHEDILGDEFTYTDRFSVPLIDLQKTDRPYQLAYNTMTRLSGPYSPIPKMLVTGARLLNSSETEAAKIRKEIETKRFLLQAAGLAGLAPLYTDAMYNLQQYEYQIYNPNYGLSEIEKRLKEYEKIKKDMGLD